MPLLTVASAISRMSLSLTLQPNLFQPSHPIGGVGARDADVCADVAGARWAAKVPTRRQAGSARIKENHRKFIFPRNIGYVTAYAESSTQRQKVRCYSTREKNSHALAYAAHKLSTAFDQDKCATGVRTLPAHTESNRRAMTFLPSKFLPALLLMPVLIDYDNDGWLDIYLLNGSTFAALKGKEAAPRGMLLHNNHDGTFTDVTEKAGVANERWGFGVAVGDYDNDGWPDIYVSNFGKNRLYHNNHDGTFTDVAETTGVAPGGWSTGATWGD